MGRDNFDKKRVVDFATEFKGGEAPPPFYTFSFRVLNIGSHVAAYSPFGALCRRHGMIDSPDSRDGCVSSYSHHLSSVVSSAQEFKPPSVFLVFADNDYAGTRFVFESVDTERIISPWREIFIPMLGLIPPPSFDCPALVPLHPS